MPAPRRPRTRRKVKKNIAVGQAHIKTSFNNTIVTLTDNEGGGSAQGARHGPEVQVGRGGGPKAFPKGRALPHRKGGRRAAVLPAGRARPRPPEAERVPRAAAREAEGPPLLRRAGEAVPQL